MPQLPDNDAQVIRDEEDAEVRYQAALEEALAAAQALAASEKAARIKAAEAVEVLRALAEKAAAG